MTETDRATFEVEADAPKGEPLAGDIFDALRAAGIHVRSVERINVPGEDLADRD